MMISGIFHKAWRPLSLLAGLRWEIRSRCFTSVSAQSRPVAKTQLSSPEEHLRRLSVTSSRRWTLQFSISVGHFEFACFSPGAQASTHDSKTFTSGELATAGRECGLRTLVCASLPATSQRGEDLANTPYIPAARSAGEAAIKSGWMD